MIAARTTAERTIAEPMTTEPNIADEQA